MFKNRKTLIRIIPLLMIGYSILAVSAWADMLDPGRPAPLFTATDIDGKIVGLSNFSGKVVVLEWANSACPAVRKKYELGIMQQLQEKAKRNGIIWLTIFTPKPGNPHPLSREEAKQAMADWKGTPTDVIIDPGNVLTALYSVWVTPTVFVINTSGNIAYEGAVDEQSAAPHQNNPAHRYLDAALETLSSASYSVNDPSMSNAAGCSVRNLW
jgi:peroxiredoxin